MFQLLPRALFDVFEAVSVVVVRVRANTASGTTYVEPAVRDTEVATHISESASRFLCKTLMDEVFMELKILPLPKQHVSPK